MSPAACLLSMLLLFVGLLLIPNAKSMVRRSDKSQIEKSRAQEDEEQEFMFYLDDGQEEEKEQGLREEIIVGLRKNSNDEKIPGKKDESQNVKMLLSPSPQQQQSRLAHSNPSLEKQVKMETDEVGIEKSVLKTRDKNIAYKKAATGKPAPAPSSSELIIQNRFTIDDKHKFPFIPPKRKLAAVAAETKASADNFKILGSHHKEKIRQLGSLQLSPASFTSSNDDDVDDNKSTDNGTHKKMMNSNTKMIQEMDNGKVKEPDITIDEYSRVRVTMKKSLLNKNSKDESKKSETGAGEEELQQPETLEMKQKLQRNSNEGEEKRFSRTSSGDKTQTSLTMIQNVIQIPELIRSSSNTNSSTSSSMKSQPSDAGNQLQKIQQQKQQKLNLDEIVDQILAEADKLYQKLSYDNYGNEQLWKLNPQANFVSFEYKAGQIKAERVAPNSNYEKPLPLVSFNSQGENEVGSGNPYEDYVDKESQEDEEEDSEDDVDKEATDLLDSDYSETLITAKDSRNNNGKLTKMSTVHEQYENVDEVEDAGDVDFRENESGKILFGGQKQEQKLEDMSTNISTMKELDKQILRILLQDQKNRKNKFDKCHQRMRSNNDNSNKILAE